jgi:hypothetical protein
MKDINHHQAKFQKKALKHLSDTDVTPPRTCEDSKEEKRKKEKAQMKEGRECHIPTHKTEEERNAEEKRNGPVRKGNTNIH